MSHWQQLVLFPDSGGKMGLVTVQVSQNAGTLSNLMHTTMHANHHACQYVNNLQATWMLIGQFLFPCVY